MPIVVKGDFKPSDPFGLYRNRSNPLAASAPGAQPAYPALEGNPANSFDTPLTASEQQAFAAWKAQYAPQDTGEDYDLRGAFKAGVTPAADGHWPDTFKKPNHPTFSRESKYAGYNPDRAGSWDESGQYVPSESVRAQQAQQAAEANAQQLQQNYQQLETKEPGRYQVIDEGGYDKWRADWQAKQPGFVEDMLRTTLGAVYKGSGTTLRGVGTAVSILGDYTTTPVINAIFGTDYTTGNALLAPAKMISGLGEKTQSGVSYATKEAIAGSTPDGDILSPSTWTLGKNPSLAGYTALALDVFGQMAPVIAASVATGPIGAAIAGGAQGGGAAEEQAHAIIDEMAAQPGVLERESAFYREQLAAGKSPAEALARTKDAAGKTAFILTAPVSAFGGYATAKILDPATAILAGKHIAARILGRAGLSGLEEGSQEAVETVATRAGVNAGAGTNLSVTDGTFADFMLGALAGGGPGGMAGALSRGEPSAQAEAPPAQQEQPQPEPAPGAAPGAAPSPGVAPAPAPTGPKPGPLSRALDYGMSKAPDSPVFIVNDPALPGYGAGPEHGQTVTLSPNQSGIDPNMRRVLMPDGTDRVMGTRLLQPANGGAAPVDPQATNTPLTVSSSMAGLPDAGSSVIVEAPGMAPFTARVEQYVDADGAHEAVVVDANGEVLQIPVEHLRTQGIGQQLAGEMDLAANPPVPRDPVQPSPTNRVVGTANIAFPDETLASLYDLGKERQLIKRLEGGSGLAMRTYSPEQVQALADRLGVLPERINEIADDYRYRAERAGKTSESGLPKKMHGLNAERLKGWQAERTKADADEAIGDKSGPVLDPASAIPDMAAPEADIAGSEVNAVADEALWWNGLAPGARKALLAAAGVKRSEKSTWDKFSAGIRTKLAPLRAEMEPPKPTTVAPTIAATLEVAKDPANLKPLTKDEEDVIRRAAQAEADQSNFPDEADDFADQAVEAARQERIREIDDAQERARDQRLLDAAANAAATSPTNDRPEPTAAQKEAGNYALGHIRLGGLDLSIENPAGSERKGVDGAGKPWSVTMKSHYGYIRGTVGKDKDHIDLFIKPGTDTLADDAPLFVVDQKNANGRFDEHKVMAGFASMDEARAGYMANYSKDWKGLGAVTETTLAKFKEWLKSGDTSERFVDVAAPKSAADQDAAGTRVKLYDEAPGQHAVVGEFNQIFRWVNSLPEAEYLRLAGQYDGAAGIRRTVLNSSEPLKLWEHMKADAAAPAPTDSGKSETAKPREAAQAEAEVATRPDAQPTVSKRRVKAPSVLDRLENYFRPGREMVGGHWGGGDRVVSFDRGTGGLWSVRVIGLEEGARERRHSTQPTEKQLAAWEKDNPVPVQEAPARKAAGTVATSADTFAKNKLFTADKVEAARARLKAKMGQLNSGIDPEVLVDGMTIAGAYIEAGVRDFSDYATRMSEDFGDRIKPYLLSFWEGARNYPGLDIAGMTAAADSARLHSALLSPLPQEEAPALGQELAAPKARTRKTGKAADRTLIQDFGVDHIDGWTDTADGAGVETDYGLRGGVKDNFLKDAMGYLRAVADLLQEDGYTPTDDAKGRPMKAVNKNESGPATSGDVAMTLWHPETGTRVYAHIGGTALRGTVPTTRSGVSLMFRVGMDTDRYATRSMNQWAPVDLSAEDFAAMVRQQAKRVVQQAKTGDLAADKQSVIADLKALIARPALTPAPEAGNEQAQSRVGSPDPQGVGGAAAGRDDRAQSGAARADNRDLEADQPEILAPAAERGDGRETGVRPATANVDRAGTSDGGGNAGDGRSRAGGTGAPDAGAGSRAGSAGRDVDPGPVVKDPATVSPANPGPGNFHIADPLQIVGGGQVARFEKNKAAITLAGVLRDEGRAATTEEQAVLAGYTGWGSFGQDLFQGTWAHPRPKAGWEARDTWLRDNVGQAEWESLQRSITNAHYTDPPTVLAMWDMMQRMGFAGGRVLEPSMGIGNFFGMMPLALKNRSKLAGIELESVTGEMAKLLYPDANIHIMGYQQSKTPDNFYDVVIGNWPFENTVIADRRYNRLSPLLHDYFYLKALDQVRPGGLVIGITSKGTMDKKESTIRTELAKKGELVAAFRLPSGAFEEYAGTKVVTDIIILRKRATPLGVAADAGWIKSVPFQTPSGQEVSLNEYYVTNPSHVIGTIDYGHGTTSARPGMIVHRPADMAEQLKRIVSMVPEGAYQADARAGEQISYITNHTDDREGALTQSKGDLFVVRGEHLVAAEDVQKFALKDAKATETRRDQLTRLIDMRKAYAALISAERDPSGTNPEPVRAKLRKQYESFVEAHGVISDSFGLSYLRKLDEPFYPALAALETRSGKGIKPAQILTKSTIRGARRIDKPTVSDAFVLARNSSVNPSLGEIAKLAQQPEDVVRAELLAKGAVFELPGGDIVPGDIYLSGNVREKLRQAQSAVEAGQSEIQRNVDALLKVMPPDIPYFNIETQMGASWVSTSVYADYVAHMLNAPTPAGIEVRYVAGRWRITLDDKLMARAEAGAGFGTSVYSFRKLVNAAISNQTVTIRKEDSDGNTYVDQDETAEVNGKIETIRQSFGDWLWSDPTRRIEMETEYNEVRNAFASPKFDGSFLSFEGMALSLGNGPFDLRQHQVDAIWRALVTRRSLNAHEVGTGKTFTMGGIAVESRRYGLAKKPLILAHNANSKSVAAEIQQMYPAAKVLYIDNLAPAQIDVKMRQIANDDWDAVVVPHSLISRFALTEETLMALAQEEIAAIEAEAYAAAEEDGSTLTEAMLDDPEELKKLRSPTAKDLVKMRNRIIETIKKQGQRASKEGALSFEELGIDMVMVDEAHEFKKPPFSTRMRIKGLNTQSSDKSIALNFLTRYIRGNNNGGNVHLFTGTPVTNTLTEVFHMMRYMMAEEMADVSVDQWDGWFGSFAKEVQDVELNAAAEYEAVTRLAGFINVPELRRMIGQYMDVVFADDMPEMQPRRTDTGKTMASGDLTEAERAQLLNGRTEGAKDRPYKKVIVDTADLTGPQQDAFRRIQEYAKGWRNFTAKQKKEAMLSGAPESPIIYENLAAKASFDVRLMRGAENAGKEGNLHDEPDSKPSRAIANVLEIYKSHPLATQVVFTSAGISNVASRSVGAVGEKTQERYKVFSTVDDIVERLVAKGIPRAQIAVVDGSTSKDKRKEVADAMNRAEIRVVIGSTQSLGVGVNMQRNLRAMHHMDAPWMPGDLEQRNGRGHRQGNQWNTVLEYRYLTDRLDGRRWQVLAIKQRFINAFLKSDDSTRIIEGDAAADEESDILQTFAEAAGDPRVLIREKFKKKIEQFKKRQRLHDTGIAEAGRTAKRLGNRNAELEREIARLGPIADKIDELVTANAGKGFAITVDGKPFESRGDAREAIDQYVEAEGLQVGSPSRVIGTFGGHELNLRWPMLSRAPILSLTVDGETVEGNVGSLSSLEAALRNFRADFEGLAPEADANRRSIARLEQAANEPFHQTADLARTLADYEALEADLRDNPVPPPAWLRAGAPVDTEIVWKGDRHVVSGHRWNAEGWFVLASGTDGPIAMPYAEVRDDQGMAVYEERPFVAPEVVTKATPKTAAPIAEDLPEEADSAAPGRKFSRVPSGTAFDRWFRGSKVVDAQGKPLVVYHGSRTDIGESFDPAKTFDHVFWFTADSRDIELYAGTTGNVTPVYLSLQNPAVLKYAAFDVLPQSLWSKLKGEAPKRKALKGDARAARFADLQAQGYDGIHDPTMDVWVAFDPTQIKSTANSGTFDPADPRILHSRRSIQTDGPRSIADTWAELRKGGLGPVVDALVSAGRIKVMTAAEADAEEGTQGWTDEDGSITLIADQIAAGDAVSVLLHEAFHSGARPLLGDRVYLSTMMRLAGLYRQFENSTGRAREFFDAARERVRSAEGLGGKLPEAMAVEEFGAYAIEEYASAPGALQKWVDDLVGAVKSWALRRFGHQLGPITPAQLRSIAQAALRDAVGGAALPQGAQSRRKSIKGSAGPVVVDGPLTLASIGRHLKGKLTDMQPSTLALIPLNYFMELRPPHMVAVDHYIGVKRQMDAYRGKKHAAIDEVAQQWRKYVSLGLMPFGPGKAAGRTRAAFLADLMHDATLAGIDPSRTDRENTDKPGYAALRERYTQLPPAGRELFANVRDTYKDQAEEMDMILLDNVRKMQEVAFRRAEDQYRQDLADIAATNKTGLDKSMAEHDAGSVYSAAMQKAVYNQKARMTKLRLAFEASRVPEPYFPLARFGRYFVSVKDVDGEIISFSKRESAAEMHELAEQMRKENPAATVTTGVMEDKTNVREAMDPRIIAEIESILGDAGVGDEVMDAIWQRYLTSMPELSARKKFIHRKGVAGFGGDALRTFASHHFHAAHQMGRLKYGIELGELVNQAVQQARTGDPNGDSTEGMTLANELKLRNEWVMNPRGSKTVQAVTSAMFVWHLAATPAAAIVNLAQTPMMGIPILGARLGGAGKASAALARASADVVRGKGNALNTKLSADERRAMEAFYESGLVERSQAHDLAGVGEVGVEYSPVRQNIMKAISWGFHQAEVLNRQSTALAAYRLARDQGQHEVAAINTAHDLTYKVHFDMANSSRARVMQGDAAKLLLVFQSYQINTWYRLFRDIKQSMPEFLGGAPSKQARKEARYQLAGIMGMMTLFGGINGFFGYNLLMALAGMVFDDDDDPRTFKAEMDGHVIDLLGPDLGGMVLRGVPGQLMGIDLTSRLGMADFFIRAPNGGEEGRDWYADLIIGALGVVPSTIINTGDGLNLIMQGKVARGIEMMAPKVVKDAMQAYRYANEGVTTRNGDETLARSNVDVRDVIAEAMGFTSAKVAETYERNSVLKDAEGHVQDERRALINRFAMAAIAGDEAARDEAIDAIKAWNKKPYAKTMPITGDSLKSSLRTRKRNAAKREDGALIADPELSHYLRNNMPERVNY